MKGSDYLKIKEMNINDLTMYENNPRNNDEAVKYVAKSIKNFGFLVPLVIDKNNVIVAGHTRYKASKELNLDKVPCVIADDLTDKQIKAFRLADNKVSEFSQWDNSLLDLELDELSNLDFDMSDFGFNLDFENESDIEESNLDEEVNKTNVTVTLTCKNISDYEVIHERLQNLVDEINATMAVKMS